MVKQSLYNSLVIPYVLVIAPPAGQPISLNDWLVLIV